MCLYPILIKNKKYLPNKKNGGNPPKCPDIRLQYVTAACGKCYECRKQKGRSWQVRLSEELRNDSKAIFVTLTISNESFNIFKNEKRSEEEILIIMVRRFLERVRKHTKKSIKHWFTTELGENTDRYHLHGIIWGENAKELTEKYWQYGFVYIGQFVNEQTINYITKYVTKIDEKHKDFMPKILCSAGIGKNYINRKDAESNKFRNEKTNETYKLRNGTKLNLPIYYRNKIYTEEEREKLFLQKIEKGIVYVCGRKAEINSEHYFRLLETLQKEYQETHGDNPREWEKIKYRRRLQRQRNAVKKIKKLKNKGLL